MIIQAGDLAVEIDTGTNKPGKVQRLENGQWVDYVKNGKPVRWPVKEDELEPGRYLVKQQ
jgi:hypothetical protein